MKKNNKLGFMLTETLIVSTFVTVTLMYMFVQFQKINQNYNRTFSYNTTNSLYATNQIINYILDVDFPNIKNALINNSDNYITLTNCPSHLFAEANYCNELFTALKVKDVYFTYDNLTYVKEAMKQDRLIDRSTITFLDYIDYNPSSSAFRIIVYFLDGTHATLRFEEEV